MPFGGFITGPGLDGGETYMGGNDSWPIWAGKADPGETIQFEIDGKTHTTTADENGAWDFTPPQALDNGDHEITVQSVDKDGNPTSEPYEMERNVQADSAARQNDYARNKDWKERGSDAFHEANSPQTGGGGGRPQTGGGGGGGGGGSEHVTAGPPGQTSSGGGGGGGGGGQPQSEKGNQARGA